VRRPNIYAYATIAALASASLVPDPLLAAVAALSAAVWGEWLLLWAYPRPLEPYRERVEIGGFKAAYDPRRGLYHFFWRAEPNRSELGASAVPTLHELYAQLSLRPGEYIAVIQHGAERYIRLTTRNPDARRLEGLEAVLGLYFILRRDAPWLPPRISPSWALYLIAALPALLAARNPGMLLAALALLYRAHAVIKWYREAVPDLAFTTVSAKRELGTSRQVLETLAGAEAAAAGRMDRWAVVLAPRSESQVEREFGRAYESPAERKGVVIRLHRTSQLLERMIKYDERPIYIQAFGDRELATQLEIKRCRLANVLFWLPSETYMTKALSCDLARFPVLYGGKLIDVGRKLLVGHDRFGRPVEIDLDAMPTAHAVVLGPSGMGKSWAVATLLRRITEQHKDISVVVIDPHGDYSKLAELIGAPVYEVPRQLPPLDTIKGSRYAHALLEEFGLAGEELEDAAALVARDAGVNDVTFVTPPADSHVVYELRMLRGDAHAQAFFVSLLLLWHLSAYGRRPPSERLERIIVVDEAALLAHTARVSETGLVINVPLNLIRQYSMGGRKYGFAVWLVAQLARHVPEDIIENAGFVLQLGGTRRALRRSAEILLLDRHDLEYLRSAATPRETASGQRDRSPRPYAAGILYLSPRDIVYHVRIPLDPELKEAPAGVP
jgi:hypothetical protein